MSKDKVVQAVVATYDKIDDEECCSYGLFSNTTDQTAIIKLSVCHSGLRWYPYGPSKFDQLVTSFPSTDAKHFRFFDFMKWSLYHKWADFIHLEFTDAGDPYILVSDLSQVPANVVYNMCICSRMFVETPTYLDVWSALCEQGLHPGFAFIVCKTHVGSDLDKTVLCVTGGVDHHWCMEPTMDMIKVLHGAPTALTAPYKKHTGGCTPTCAIWGHSKDLRGLVGITIREFWNKWKEIC